MSYRRATQPASPWRGVKRALIAVILLAFFLVFLFWRTDNPRVEALRFQILDNYVPDFSGIFAPITKLADVVTDFRSYENLIEENRELRREMQQLESWREAALQLEQTNAELRALNNLSVLPSFDYISGEIIADSGSSFSQSALINVGTNKGVAVGAPVLDGFGVVGRVTGTGQDKSRVLLLSDPTSKISALVMPERARVILRGDNSNMLKLIPVDGGVRLTPGARVVTSGAGLFPANLLVGYVATDGADNAAVRLAAKYSSLEFARVLISPTTTVISDTEIVVPGAPNTATSAAPSDAVATDHAASQGQ